MSVENLFLWALLNGEYYYIFLHQFDVLFYLFIFFNCYGIINKFDYCEMKYIISIHWGKLIFVHLNDILSQIHEKYLIITIKLILI